MRDNEVKVSNFYYNDKFNECNLTVYDIECKPHYLISQLMKALQFKKPLIPLLDEDIITCASLSNGNIAKFVDISGLREIISLADGVKVKDDFIEWFANVGVPTYRRFAAEKNKPELLTELRVKEDSKVYSSNFITYNGVDVEFYIQDDKYYFKAADVSKVLRKLEYMIYNFSILTGKKNISDTEIISRNINSIRKNNRVTYWLTLKGMDQALFYYTKRDEEMNNLLNGLNEFVPENQRVEFKRLPFQEYSMITEKQDEIRKEKMELNNIGNLFELKVDDNGNTVVDGRQLHKVLGIKGQYTKWFERMCEYGFQEKQDYITEVKNVSSQKRLRTYEETNHILNLDMAKEISMIQRSEIGKKVRNYFIAIEKAHKDNIREVKVEQPDVINSDERKYLQVLKEMRDSFDALIMKQEDLLEEKERITSELQNNTVTMQNIVETLDKMNAIKLIG